MIWGGGGEVENLKISMYLYYKNKHAKARLILRKNSPFPSAVINS